MANTAMRPPNLSFVNSRKAIAGMNGDLSSLGAPVNYVSINSLRARLAGANAGYYTAARLDQMTVNDMVFALRSIDDRETIADYMPVSTA